MSSFLMTIEQTPLYTSKADKYNVENYMQGLVMTFPRDELPRHLQGRVPLSVWQNTYDQLAMCFKEDAEITSYVAEKPFKIVFRMAKVMERAEELETKFTTLAQQQASIYQQYGVSVSLSKTTSKKKSSKVDKKSQNMRFLDTIEGLRFDLLNESLQ